MENAIELKSGFHIQTKDSKVTPLGEGIFVPYHCSGGPFMYALRVYLKEHCCSPGEEPPTMYLNPLLDPTNPQSLLRTGKWPEQPDNLCSEGLSQAGTPS